MKKLVLLNNILLILSIGKCDGDANKAVNDPASPDSLSMVMDSHSMDSGYTGMMTDSAGHSALGDSISKDSKYNAHTSNPKEAPKHNAPDQTKIDSIKAEKAKKKKG